MIVQFSVENFRSFASEETLSLVASGRLSGSHDNHLVPIPGTDEKLLRTAVIYGANGAGKSNLMKAIALFKSMAIETRDKSAGTGRERFRLGGESDVHTSLDMQFVVNGNLYRLGFKFDDKHISEEWFLRIKGSKEDVIYERSINKAGRVSVEGNLKYISEKLRALAVVGGPTNQSFMATMLANLDGDDLSEDIRDVTYWVSEGLVVVFPDSRIASLDGFLAEDPNFLDFAGKFLNSASTGVDSLKVEQTEISEEDIVRSLSKDSADRFVREIAECDQQSGVVKFTNRDILFEKEGTKTKYYNVSVAAAHVPQGMGEVLLDLDEESDGTLRLLDLLPALHHLQSEDAVYFIDEIDRSMHPALVWKFLEFFLKSCSCGNKQVIVTSHESNLLDLDLLRRDEIWFAEKDASLSTRLYSLADFKVRKDLEIRKHYLQGRFGAVPFLGNVDRLLEGCEGH